jgi:hypothetical protein
MLETLTNMGLTAVMVIIGPILLAVGLAYGIANYRRRNRGAKEMSDRAAARLYREGAAAERRGDPEPTKPL